jgi:hypothetical protein
LTLPKKRRVSHRSLKDRHSKLQTGSDQIHALK